MYAATLLYIMAEYLFMTACEEFEKHEYGPACVHFTEACNIYKILKGEESSEVYTCELFIGKCLGKQSHYAVSLDVFLDLYNRCKNYYNEDHKAIIDLELHIGSCYAELKQYRRAIGYYNGLLSKVDDSKKQYIEHYIKACELRI